MTYEVQQTRWDRLIRRVSGSIGPGSRVSETISELFPVLEVERTTPELLALSDWRLAWQSTERPAVAGQQNASQLFNPPESGVIVAVTQVRLHVNVVDTPIQMEISSTVVGVNQVKGLFRDSRFGGDRETVAEVSSADNVVTGGGPRIYVSADDLIIRDDNGLVVLTPGFGLSVGTVGNNILLTVNYFWRERPAQESELSF